MGTGEASKKRLLATTKTASGRVQRGTNRPSGKRDKSRLSETHPRPINTVCDQYQAVCTFVRQGGLGLDAQVDPNGHEEQRDKQGHPIIRPAPEEQGCDPKKDQRRGDGEGKDGDGVPTSGKAQVLECLGGARSELPITEDARHADTDGLQLRKIRGKAQQEDAQGEAHHGHPHDSGKDEPTSMQACALCARRAVADRGLRQRGLNRHLGTPFSQAATHLPWETARLSRDALPLLLELAS